MLDADQTVSIVVWRSKQNAIHTPCESCATGQLLRPLATLSAHGTLPARQALGCELSTTKLQRDCHQPV